VPFSQSVMLDQELTRLGMPHKFYSYEGPKHYFSTSAADATTCNWQSVAWRMFRDSLDCLRRGLGIRRLIGRDSDGERISRDALSKEAP
jgi:hypothetical protein